MVVRWKGWPTLVSTVGFAVIKGWGEGGLLGLSALPSPTGCNCLAEKVLGRETDEPHSLSPRLSPCLPVSGDPRAVVVRPVSTQGRQRLPWVMRKTVVSVAGDSPKPSRPSLPPFPGVGCAAAS